MRVELDKWQAGAYVELRDMAPFGLVKMLRPKLDESGNEIPMVLDDYALSMVRYLVKDWKIANLDGDELGAPKTISLLELEFVQVEIIVKIVEEANAVLAKANPDPNSVSVS